MQPPKKNQLLEGLPGVQRIIAFNDIAITSKSSSGICRRVVVVDYLRSSTHLCGRRGQYCILPPIRTHPTPPGQTSRAHHPHVLRD